MKVLFAVLLVLLAGFPPDSNPSAVAAVTQRPGDFSIDYRWRAATVPPPHHFEYTITISPTGAGKIMMIPGYPSNTVPRWTETFTVDTQQMDKLYALMVDNGLFKRGWKPLARQPIGGSRQYLTVKAGGKEISIQSTMAADDQKAAEAVYSAVSSTVPKAIWDKLNAQREEYMEKHKRG